MLWVSYGKISAEGIKGMIASPENRAAAVSKLVEALGGKLVSYHMLVNGDIDFFIVTDMPDDKAGDLQGDYVAHRRGPRDEFRAIYSFMISHPSSPLSSLPLASLPSSHLSLHPSSPELS